MTRFPHSPVADAINAATASVLCCFALQIISRLSFSLSLSLSLVLLLRLKLQIQATKPYGFEMQIEDAATGDAPKSRE